MKVDFLEMRRSQFAMSEEESWALLGRSPVIHIATSAGEDRPIFRSMHGVIVGRFVAFHGAPVGEKTLALGRRAVLSAEDIIVDIPSYFTHETNACPATTFYESVQAHGRLERVDDLERKGQVLQGLMERYQPEGGYLSIAENLGHYEKALRGILIFGMTPERVTGKKKLGQNWSDAKLGGVLKRLWERGNPGDAEAIERILTSVPGRSYPEFLKGPGETVFVPQLRETRDFEDAGALLEGQYWTQGLSGAELVNIMKVSQGCIGLRGKDGGLLAFGRISGDGRRSALISDVVVREDQRGRGLGRALMTFLLDHPALRQAREVALRTRDAQAFYRRFDFVSEGAVTRAFESERMLRLSS